MKIADQDSSDSEKALAYLLREDCHEVLMLGARGSRLDHSLFNIQLLERFAGRLRILLLDADSLSLRIGAGESASWPLPEGARFSLLPLGGPAEGVTLAGAAYRLANARLAAAGGPTAISNRVEKTPLRISVDRGSLLFSLHLALDDDSRATDP